MAFLSGSTISPGLANVMDPVLRYIFIVLDFLIALGIGLFLRRLLVRRLKKTVLDGWIIQTLGVFVVVIPLIPAAAVAPVIYDWNISSQTFALLWRWISGTNAPSAKDLTDLGLNLIKTALLIALGIGVARTVKKLTIGNLAENHIDINIRTLIGRIFYFLILLIALFWILSVWQVSVTIPVATLGLTTVLFTVAIQDILKDLVAGFYILIERPFYIGDQVTISTYTGKVENVQLRATKLRLVSGEEVTIPNALVFGGIVVNNSYYGERRAVITVKLPQEKYVPDETTGQIVKMLKDFENVVDAPEPGAMITNFGDGKVTLTIRFWIIRGQFATISEVMHALHKLLPDGEITLQEAAGNV
jgi:small-conductance mechanosensitive channel